MHCWAAHQERIFVGVIDRGQPTAADSNVGFHAEVLEANLHLG